MGWLLVNNRTGWWHKDWLFFSSSSLHSLIVAFSFPDGKCGVGIRTQRDGSICTAEGGTIVGIPRGIIGRHQESGVVITCQEASFKMSSDTRSHQNTSWHWHLEASSLVHQELNWPQVHCFFLFSSHHLLVLLFSPLFLSSFAQVDCSCWFFHLGIALSLLRFCGLLVSMNGVCSFSTGQFFFFHHSHR